MHLRYTEVSGHEMEVVHFVECIRENKAPMATGEQGLHIQKILDAIYKSSSIGCWGEHKLRLNVGKLKVKGWEGTPNGARRYALRPKQPK